MTAGRVSLLKRLILDRPGGDDAVLGHHRGDQGGRGASYELLRADGEDPVLILDDVFAELDTGRRDRLATLVADAEQVIVTAAVLADVPATLTGARFSVGGGTITRDG